MIPYMSESVTSTTDGGQGERSRSTTVPDNSSVAPEDTQIVVVKTKCKRNEGPFKKIITNRVKNDGDLAWLKKQTVSDLWDEYSDLHVYDKDDFTSVFKNFKWYFTNGAGKAALASTSESVKMPSSSNDEMVTSASSRRPVCLKQQSMPSVMSSSTNHGSISAETAVLLRLEELRAETSRNNKEAAEKQEKIEEKKLLQQENTILNNCMTSNSNCWKDLQKNNTTALDTVVKANGEGLDKMISGNEKIHQTIKQRRRTLGGTKAVLVADDDDYEHSPKDDIPRYIGHGHGEGEDDGISLLTEPLVETKDEESNADTFFTAPKSTADTIYHSVASTESETKAKMVASLKTTTESTSPSTESETKAKTVASLKATTESTSPSTESEMKGLRSAMKSKGLKKEKSVKWKEEPENCINSSSTAKSSSRFTTPIKKKNVNNAPKTCPGPPPLRRSIRNRTPRKLFEG